MTHVCMIGNVAGEIDLRYAPSGKAVAKFSLACTPREKQGDQWVDGATTWVRVTAFGRDAENAAESFKSGTRVLVYGRLKTEEWNHKETGEKRSALCLLADEIGASVKFRQVTVREAERSGGASKPPPVAPDPWGNDSDDEPPF